MAFSSHDVQHINGAAVAPIENPAGRLNDLAIAPAAQFLWLRAAIGMSDELFDVLEYTLHQVARRCGIVEGDVIGYRVEIVVIAAR